jgi:hypothetical protein
MKGFDAPSRFEESICDVCEPIFVKNGFRHYYSFNMEEFYLTIEKLYIPIERNAIIFSLNISNKELLLSSGLKPTKLEYFDLVDVQSTADNLNILLLFS